MTWKRTPLIASLLVVMGLSGSAELLERAYQLSEYPAIAIEDLPERHRRWLTRDVHWLITDDERDVFLRLAHDDRRDRFIEEFWRQRDPSPGTTHNEYRVAVEERVAEATRRFGRGAPTPGWRSDRGRIFILLGEPQSILDLPNTQLAVPLQLWTYAVDPTSGLPPFFYVMFYKRNGFGDYRLYGPVSDGPEELLNEAGRAIGRGSVAAGRVGRLGGPTGVGDVAGMLSTLADIDPEVANAAINLIPGSGSGPGSSPLRSELLIAQIEDLPSRILPSPAWAVRFLVGDIDTAVRFPTLPAEMRAVALLDPSGIPFVHLLVRAPAARLNLQERETGGYLTFEIAPSLFDARDRALLRDPKRNVEVGLDAQTASVLRDEHFYYLDRIPAISGRLKIALTVENPVSREFAQREISVEVPSRESDAPWSSPPLLVYQHEELGAAYDEFGPHTGFQLGPNFVLPVIDGPFAEGATVWIYHQVRARQVPSEPVRAEYRLVDSTGRVVARRAVVLPLDRRDRHGTLNQLSGVSLEGVAPGHYHMRVDVSIPGWRTAELPVRVVPAGEVVPPFVHAPTRPPATDPAVAVARVEALRVAGRLDEAAELAVETLAREPASAEALGLAVEIFFDLNRPDRVHELLVPRLAVDPDRPQFLLWAGEAAALSERHWDAIRFYERARLNGQEDTPELLNMLAGEYLAEGDRERGRRLLARSLELEPDQPAIRALLRDY